jgi:predicted Zn-dependent protease with MMP-like domain
MGKRVVVSRGRFRRFVRRAMDALPPNFRAAADNVLVVVEPTPTAADYHFNRPADAGARRRAPLFGIYRGVPLPERTAGYQMAVPDVIAVFRRPLLRYCRTRRQLEEEIGLTVLHEMGHYFGLDEPSVEHL